MTHEIEVTEEMQREGLRIFREEWSAEKSDVDLMTAVYRAMAAAAPKREVPLPTTPTLDDLARDIASAFYDPGFCPDEHMQLRHTLLAFAAEIRGARISRGGDA